MKDRTEKKEEKNGFKRKTRRYIWFIERSITQ